MNRTKLLTIAVIGLLLINLGTLGVLVMQRPHHPPMGDGPPQRREGPKQIIIDRLHFDLQQQQAYSILVEEHRKRTRELNATTRQLHDELFVLLKIQPVDTAKANSLMQQIAQNQQQTDQLNFEHFQQIKNICKPGQVVFFNELVDDLGKLFEKER